jgi:hypothetical protein
MKTDQKPHSRPGDVYDPENDDKKPGAYQHWRPPGYDKDNSGYDPANPSSKSNNPDVAKGEKNSDTSDGQKTAANDKERNLQNQDSDSLGSGYSPGNTPKKTKARSKVKKRLIFAVITVVFTVVGALVTMSPSFLINHMRDILTGKIGELSTSHSRRYKRKNIHKVSDLFSRDGRLGGRVIADMEHFGYKFRFSLDNPNHILGISPPGSNVWYPSSTGAAYGVVDEFVEIRHPLMFSRFKTKRMNALTKRFNVLPRSVVKKTPNDIDGDPDSTLRRNMAQATYNGEGDIPNLHAQAVDPKEGDATPRTGFDDSLSNGTGSFDDIRKKLVAEGVDIDKIDDKDLSRILRSLGGEVDEDLIKAVNRVIARGSLSGKVFHSLRGLLDVTEVPDRICTLKNRIRAGGTAARTVSARAMMKLALAYISGADGVRMGAASSELLGSLLRNITSPDSSGLPIGAAPGFTYALNGRFSRSANNYLKPGYSVNGKPTGLVSVFTKSTDSFPGTGQKACGVWQNPVTQIGLGIGQVVLFVFTGGTLNGGIKAGITAAKASLSRVFTKSAVTAAKRFLKRVIIIEITFEAVGTIMQLYTEKMLTLPTTTQSKGGKLGGEITAGGGVLSKQRNLMAGQIPATSGVYAEAYEVFLAEKKEEMKNTSILARIFDYGNLNSLAFNTVSRVAFSAPTLTGISNNISTSLISVPGSILGTFGRLISPSVYAADDDEVTFETYVVEGNGAHAGEELATDPAGNLLTVLPEDIIEADPVQNEQDLLKTEGGGPYIDAITKEPIGVFAEHVEKCVNNIDTISVIEGGDPTNLAEDCLAVFPITRKFKVHLAYLDMLDGLEAEFLPEEISGSGGNAVFTTSVVDTEIESAEDTSNLPCAPGFTSQRVVPVGNGKIRVKLCSYGEVRDVNASWSNNVSSMLATAKSERNLSFAGGGFRTAARQIALRKANCGTTHYDIYEKPSSKCHPSTARPGTSNHELGLAIDFSNMCYPNSTCNGNPRYDWLVTNSQRWGIKKLGSEAWHWSWNGH